MHRVRDKDSINLNQKTMKTIKTLDELVALLNKAKKTNGGQFVSLLGESEVKLNKFPKEGERVRIDEAFAPVYKFCIEYNFGADYEKRMAKLLGVDKYDASDANRKHLVSNCLMQYISTGKLCFICMPNSFSKKGVFLNGKELTAEQVAYMNLYKAKRNASMYITMPISKVKELHLGGEVYVLDIQQSTYAVAV